MINHARTLLLNRAGAAQPRPDIAYDAYTPEYTPLVRLPPGVAYARALLFGSDPDYQGMCMRAAQCLVVVAGTPYAGYLRAIDPRVTYDFTTQRAVDFPDVHAEDTAGLLLGVTGAWQPPAGTGRSVSTWHITWGTEYGTVVSTAARDVEIPVAQTFVLPGSQLMVSAAGTPVAGSTWRVAHRAVPGPGLAQAVDNILAAPGAMSELFPAADGEPVPTFHALATSNAMGPMRAAGVILGLIWRMEALGRG